MKVSGLVCFNMKSCLFVLTVVSTELKIMLHVSSSNSEHWKGK